MHAVYKYETLCKDRCPKATTTRISFRDKIARCSVWKALWKIVEDIFITLFSTWTWNLASFSFTSASIPGATFCAVLQPLQWCCVKCVIHHERDVREEQHHIYVARTCNNRVIMACELYCCLLPQCEALRTCRSGFPIATAETSFRMSYKFLGVRFDCRFFFHWWSLQRELFTKRSSTLYAQNVCSKGYQSGKPRQEMLTKCV